MNWPGLAERIARGETLPDTEVVSTNAKRTTVRVGDAFLKVFRVRPEVPAREAEAIRRAATRGVPVPHVLGVGRGWIATADVGGRPAGREDLEAILRVVGPMHAAGVLHGDLHLGNLMATPEGIVVLDWQRARFWPRVPGFLRRWELGFLAFSLGEPLPPEFEYVRGWCERRAHTHWRSRTKRSTIESSGFTRFDEGWRRREVDAVALRAAIASAPQNEPLKRSGNGDLFRAGPWILKRHRSAHSAARAWRNGQGLEARGIRTGRAVAWRGPWLVMEDAGETLIDWVERGFSAASEAERHEAADALGNLLAALHRRGIYHADLKANNIAWRPGVSPRLLDYADVTFARSVSSRRREKNLAQLNAALPDEVPSSLRERAFRRYLEGVPVDTPDALRRRVIDASRARKHRWTGRDCPAASVSSGGS